MKQYCNVQNLWFMTMKFFFSYFPASFIKRSNRDWWFQNKKIMYAFWLGSTSIHPFETNSSVIQFLIIIIKTDCIMSNDQKFMHYVI